MKRLLLQITMLTLIFGGLIPIIGALGKTAPPPEFAKWFTYPDGSPCPMPCLFGIRPGVTKVGDVDAIVRSHPTLTDIQSVKVNSSSQSGIGGTIRYTFFGGSLQLDLYIKDLRERVDGALLVFYGPVYLNEQKGIQPLSFKESLLVLGYPYSVAIPPYQGDSNIWLIYKQYKLFVLVDDLDFACLFKPQAAIKSVFFYSPELYQKEIEEEPTLKTLIVRWIGFSKYTYWQTYYANVGAPLQECVP